MSDFVTWTGVEEAKRALEKMVDQANKASEEIVTKGAFMIQRESNANFDKSPGPRNRTGNLRQSIRPDPARKESTGVYSILIGPRKVYGRRVELGFSGTDSLGRTYNQRPHPYFTPAVQKVKPQLEKLAASIWASYI